MSKSVELGRAVLSSPATNHELWLTTLITISSEDATYLQQLTSPQCLDVLMSGNTWVKRAHDMHVEMKLSLHEDSLPYNQLQDLTDAVLHAPVWDQLMLKPTQRTDTAVDPGTIRLDINHASTMGVQERKERHRLFSGVPAADVRPPEGVTEILLHSVRLCMDILETSPRRKSTTKRSNSSRSERRASTVDEEESDTLLHEMAPGNLLQDGDADRNPTAAGAAAYRKRKRSATGTVMLTQPDSLENPRTSKRQRKRLANDCSMPHKSCTDSTSPDRIDIASMVDGAMRLSICGTLNRTAVGWKSKASTFRLGLVDVAPAMWRTGYLVALSQRGHLIPTIARSLARVGSVNSTSITLKDKMKRLSTTAQGNWSSLPSGKWPVADHDATEVHSAIARRLWVTSQRILQEKPTVSIQNCVASSPREDHPVSDDMLAEEEPLWHNSWCTTSFKANSPRELSNDPSASAESTQTVQQNGRHLGSPYLDTNVRESGDDLLLVSDFQDNMANTSRSADTQSHTPSSSDEYPLSMLLVPIQQSAMTGSSHCVEIPQTTSISSDHTPIAGPEDLDQPLFENDVECSEELLLNC